ncbi:MAG: DUF3135 domain-containing protein [Thiobacillaceae bacterium]
MQPDPSVSFDFDTWATLAKEDAAAFERRREELLQQFIAQAPQHLQERLRRLQWRIDAERRRYKHPLKSCMALHAMMWESMYGSGGLLEALNRLRDPFAAKPQQTHKSGDILPFRR